MSSSKAPVRATDAWFSIMSDWSRSQRRTMPGIRSIASTASAFLSAASAVRMARRPAFPAAASGFPVSALLARARANRMTAAATAVCPRTGCSR